MRKLLVLVLPAFFLGGCSSCRKDEHGAADASLATAPPGDGGASTRAGAESDAGRAAQRRRMFPGVVGMFVAAARETSRDEAQSSKIDEITKPLLDDDPSRRTEENELRADVLASVKAGQVDAAKMNARYAAVEKTAASRTDAEANALTSLHALLEPAQRKAVAADVKSKVTTRLENAKGRDGEKAKPTDDRSKKRAERLEKDLALDAEQKKKLATISAAHERKSTSADVWKRQLALAEAFEKDTFDAKKVEGGGFAGKAPPPQLVDDAKFYVDLAAALKPDQREKLAAVMEGKGGGRPGRGGWGRRGPGGAGGHGGHDHGHGGLPGLPGMPGGPGGPATGPTPPEEDDD
jgi:Spy/CpxP family protein refolding chaperone